MSLWRNGLIIVAGSVAWNIGSSLRCVWTESIRGSLSKNNVHSFVSVEIFPMPEILIMAVIFMLAIFLNRGLFAEKSIRARRLLVVFLGVGDVLISIVAGWIIQYLFLSG
jgi:hypothetical protein